jgi:tetratricopeptide (TPR) repeat protein
MAGCGGQPKGPAYDRFGITKPVKAAEPALAKAYTALYDLKFETARDTYARLVKDLADCAEAHLGLSMTLRYMRDQDRAVVEAKKALELDPDAVGAQLDYADLLAPYRGAQLPESLSKDERVKASTELLLKAAASPHPLSAYAHTQLWVNYLADGDLAEARAQLDELGRREYFPPLLVEMAHNLLVSAEPDAIIFTNGDNDTYPLLVLQAHKGFRRDVTVVNLSLLNLVPVAKLWRDSMNVPISWDEAKFAAFQPRYDSALRRPLLQSDLLVADIIANAPARNRPVYFATTVVPAVWQQYRSRLVLEGLVWRVAGSGEPGDSLDLDRTVKNLGQFQLDALGKPQPWPANLSPLTRNVSWLNINYMALYGQLAERFERRGDKEQALDYCRRMYRLADATGNKDWKKMAVQYWLRIRPDDKEAQDLDKKLQG